MTDRQKYVRVFETNEGDIKVSVELPPGVTTIDPEVGLSIAHAMTTTMWYNRRQTTEFEEK